MRSSRAPRLRWGRAGAGAALAIAASTTACGDGSGPGAAPTRPGEPIQLPSPQVIHESDQLFDVRDLTMDDEGRVWFLTGGEPFIHRVDPGTGEYVAYGRQGSGPGELRSPQRFAADWTDGGEIWIYDGANRRLVRADQEGVDREELPYPSFPRATAGLGEVYGDAATLFRAGDAFVQGRYDRGRPTHREFWTAELVRVPVEGGEPTPIFDFATLLSEEEAAERFGTTEILLPIPLWTVCPGDEVVIFDPIESAFTFAGPTGVVRDSLVVEAPPRPTFTPEEIFEMLVAEMVRATAEAGIEAPEEELRRELESEMGELRDEIMGSGGAPAVDLLCDGAGNLWLRHFEREGGLRGAGRTWSRYDREGQRQVMVFPDRFEVYALDEDRAWGVLFDELDVPRIAVVELPPE